MKDATCNGLKYSCWPTTQWPPSCHSVSSEVGFRDRFTDGLWAKTFPVSSSGFSPLLHPALCPRKRPHPSFPAFEHWAQMIRRLGKRWESEKRLGFSPSQAVVWQWVHTPTSSPLIPGGPSHVDSHVFPLCACPCGPNPYGLQQRLLPASGFRLGCHWAAL